MSERERDDALTVDMIRTIGEISRPDRPGHEHPLTTDARFGDALDALTDSVARLEPPGAARQVVRRARSLTGDDRSPAEELHRALDAVVHAFHQLDHRTKAERFRPEPRIVRPVTSTGRPTLAIVKPSWGSNGGFERHIATLADALAAEFDVTHVDVDGVTRPSMLWGLPVNGPMLARHDGFFLHAALIERIDRLDLSAFDVVLTTQPSTYLVDHPRKVALFYHQPRQFYDLADRFAEAGFADAELHRLASETIRDMERHRLDRGGTHWLAGSDEVAERLRHWWDIDPEHIEVHRTTPPGGIADPAPATPDGPVVMVSRHEWPKRAGLAVAAAHAMRTDREVVLIGSGSRLERSRSLDADLGAGARSVEGLTDNEIWQHAGVMDPAWTASTAPPSGRVRFVTDADDAERDRLVAGASVVLCLAHREDHGHTPIEAMALGKPVVICTDGGGLLESVEHEVTGLVADPTPAAVAAAIDGLLDDPARAERFGRAGRERVSGMSWATSAAEVADALRRQLARRNPD